MEEERGMETWSGRRQFSKKGIKKRGDKTLIVFEVGLLLKRRMSQGRWETGLSHTFLGDEGLRWGQECA